ncbi:hypothetical protein POM88_002047 [Heracleum sosnowskyi]|uniref:Uncharacterized protein n=1 Tax=Heracleum sosnowskyi TaxID=360622 RepID=A0AAD8JDP6_9APIA|nr:hypothetical protein POM88_002047 [Heracleum sosnowskyi]
MRRGLWTEISNIASIISGKPWCCTGDYNVLLDVTETLGGDNSWNIGIDEFRDGLFPNSLVDLNSMGEVYTWWNSSIEAPIFRELDRILVNGELLNTFPMSYAFYMPRLLSDHSPGTVTLGVDWLKIGKPFQFYHHLVQHPDFLSIVRDTWSVVVYGDPWYILSTKLKHLKKELKKLNVSNGNLKAKVEEAGQNLVNFQSSMPSPRESDFLQESILTKEYSSALKSEEEFLRQKSRAIWVKMGDGNHSYFFNFCRGSLVQGHSNIAAVAVNFFLDILGKESLVDDFSGPSSLASFRI